LSGILQMIFLSSLLKEFCYHFLQALLQTFLLFSLTLNLDTQRDSSR